MKSHIPKDVAIQIEDLKKRFNVDNNTALKIMAKSSKVGIQLADISEGMKLNLRGKIKWL